MQAPLEIKRNFDSEWTTWENQASFINIDYLNDRMLCQDDMHNGYVVEPLFREPIILIDGSMIWDYRVDKKQSFRERRAACDRCDG